MIIVATVALAVLLATPAVAQTPPSEAPGQPTEETDPAPGATMVPADDPQIRQVSEPWLWVPTALSTALVIAVVVAALVFLFRSGIRAELRRRAGKTPGNR